MSLVPFSIPSPPDSWSTLVTIPFDQWFSAVGLNFGQAVQINTYAICILLGIIAATMLTSRRLTRHGAEPGIVLDIIIWAVPLGLVGARLYHVATHPGDYFYEGADPWEIIRIWNGGNAIFGSLIGGAVGAFIGARMTGIRFWSFADALAPAMPSVASVTTSTKSFSVSRLRFPGGFRSTPEIPRSLSDFLPTRSSTPHSSTR